MHNVITDTQAVSGKRRGAPLSRVANLAQDAPRAPTVGATMTNHPMKRSART